MRKTFMCLIRVEGLDRSGNIIWKFLLFDTSSVNCDVLHWAYYQDDGLSILTILPLER